MAEPRGRSGGTNRDTGARREKTLPKWKESEGRLTPSREPRGRPLPADRRAPVPEPRRGRQPSTGGAPRTAGAQKEPALPDRPQTPPNVDMRSRPAPPQRLRKPDPMGRMFGGSTDLKPNILPDPDFAALANLIKQMTTKTREGVHMLAERSGLTPQPYWETLGRPRPVVQMDALGEKLPDWMVPNEDGFQAKLKKWIQDRMAA